jgi:hypothetical protein
MNTPYIVNKLIDVLINTEFVYELSTNQISIIYQEYAITIKF